MPNSFSQDQVDVLNELNRRRSTLTPDQSAILDELNRRAGLQASPQAQPDQQHGMIYNAAQKALNWHPYQDTGNSAVDALQRGFDGVGLAQGAAKGIMSTIAGAGSIVNMGLNHFGYNQPINQDNLHDLLQSNSGAQSYGKAAEQVAEYALGEGAVNAGIRGMNVAGKAGKILSLGGRAAANSAIGALQSGGDPTSAVVAGAVPLAGEALGAGVKAGQGFFNKATAGRALTPEAIQMAKDAGIPLTYSDKTGNPVTRLAENLTGHTVAADTYQPIKTAQANGVNDLASSLAGHTQPVDAVKAVNDSLTGRIDDLDNLADQHYQDFRDEVAQNKRRVQVGTKTSSILDANGNPQQVPVYDDIDTPIDMRGVKDTLQPLADRVKAVNDVVNYTPRGYLKLFDIMNSPDAVSADVADRALSNLKDISRDAEMKSLMDKSQGMASKAISYLEPALQDALQDASPKAQQALLAGRQAVKQKYQLADLLREISGDASGDRTPATALSKLISKGDFNYDTLLKPTLDASPDLAKPLREAWLDQQFNPAVNGQDIKPETILTRFNTLGPKTKQALFPGQWSNNISTFLTLAKRLNWNVNTSNTGLANAMLKFIGHPVTQAISLTAGSFFHPTALLDAYGARKIGQMLMQPEGASALRTILAAGVNSGRGRAARAVLSKIAESLTASQPQSAAGQQQPVQ